MVLRWGSMARGDLAFSCVKKMTVKSVKLYFRKEIGAVSHIPTHVVAWD